jgi:hypothetical protein
VEDGVYLLIKVKENPRLERIEVIGNDELDQDDILKKITLVKGQIVTPARYFCFRSSASSISMIQMDILTHIFLHACYGERHDRACGIEGCC